MVSAIEIISARYREVFYETMTVIPSVVMNSVRYREVSAIKHVRYREVPLYFISFFNFSNIFASGILYFPLHVDLLVRIFELPFIDQKLLKLLFTF